MNKSAQQITDHRNPEGGTFKSYVVGFILSLVFTLIPYFLVVSHAISGTSLLLSILIFAGIQLVIQLVFFLHIGRGPQPNWNVYFLISTLGIILVVVGGSVMIINNLHYNMKPSDQVDKLANSEGIYQIGGTETGACQGQYANHKVTIKNGAVSPASTQASKCDTLTFVNEDAKNREITFGTHPNHGVYAGENEIIVRKGKPKSITLSEIGAYQFHDHTMSEVGGSFTVKD